MLIEVKDLQEGDEVITPSNGSLVYAKIIRRPAVKTKVSSWHDPNKIYYKSVVCMVSIKEQVYTRTYGVGPNARTHTWKRKEYSTDDAFNTQKRIDFNYRAIWLIKRNGEKI